MRLFLFAIGGTGARVVRSLTMMLASGVDGLDSSTEIVPIIIDYDLSNGDKTRAIKVLENYSAIHQRLYPDTAQGKVYDDHFFMTKLTPLNHAGVANSDANLKNFEFNFGPSGSAIKFSDYLNMQSLNTMSEVELTESLLYALYDNSDCDSKNAELELDMAKGFKGNPNIGSVVFHDLRESPEFIQFQSTFNAATDKVFIVSSIFGGTGASGFPEIVNAIRTSTLATLSPATIGSALVLPYFDLQQFHPERGDTGAIDASSFNAKTRAALSFYATPGGINDNVNALYYIGDENHDAYDYNEGENRQKNDAHVVEFVAASAIIDFLLRPVNNSQHRAYEFSIREARVEHSIQLPDFEKSTHKLLLNNLSAFVIAMKYYREVICGDRSQISSNTAYYSRFSLSEKLEKGFYCMLDDFLNANYAPANDWGFYSWFKELQTHTHKLYPYVLDKNQEMKNVLSHKTIEAPHSWQNNPIKDATLASELNSSSQNLPNYSEQMFLKVLRDVMKAKYLQVK